MQRACSTSMCYVTALFYINGKIYTNDTMRVTLIFFPIRLSTVVLLSYHTINVLQDGVKIIHRVPPYTIYMKHDASSIHTKCN